MSDAPVFDIAIRNGTLYDGTGAPPRVGDLAVEGGRIVSVGVPVPAGTGVEEVDAAGLAVCPGFIDLHAHSDISLLSDPGCVSSVAQGITTQAVGLCGFSAAPVSPRTVPSMVEEEPHAGYPDVAWDWETTGGYLGTVGRARPATNVVTLVGHNTLRRFVMGTEKRSPTAPELGRMGDVLRAALREGARGFSTGLSYAPGCFADQDELVALARVAAEEGRPYHTHMRYGGLHVREMLAEALETAERSGVALNVSHLFPSRADPADEADRVLDMLEGARAGGVEVTFDLTPFPWGGGAWAQSLPPWARDGGAARTVERLRDPATRARIIAETWGPGAAPWMSEWDDQLIVKVARPENAALVGRSIGQIARARGRPPKETALDLLAEDGQFWVAPITKRQADLDRMLAHPLCVPMTDGMSSHPEKHRALGLMPKSFGALPLVLGSYVRERGVLPLAEAIRRMTSVPAKRLGIADRGSLAPGCAADVVVFDPTTVANRATGHRHRVRGPVRAARRVAARHAHPLRGGGVDVSEQRYVEDVAVGATVGPVPKDTSRARLVAYAGATLDDYLIHLDREFARSFGLPDVIVQGPLKSAYLGQLARDWAGERGTLRELEVQYRGIDVAVEPLTARGMVTRKLAHGGEQLVECEIWLESRDGARNTRGRALVALPSRAASPGEHG